jgi:hypothetical protein
LGIPDRSQMGKSMQARRRFPPLKIAAYSCTAVQARRVRTAAISAR